jgi:hypothetical protein
MMGSYAPALVRRHARWKRVERSRQPKLWLWLEAETLRCSFCSPSAFASCAATPKASKPKLEALV